MRRDVLISCWVLNRTYYTIFKFIWYCPVGKCSNNWKQYRISNRFKISILYNYEHLLVCQVSHIANHSNLTPNLWLWAFAINLQTSCARHILITYPQLQFAQYCVRINNYVCTAFRSNIYFEWGRERIGIYCIMLEEGECCCFWLFVVDADM